MIVRQHLECPGCASTVLARVSVFPTDLLRFYVLCPACSVPIRGSVEGHELADARLRFDADNLDGGGDVPAPAVTVDPSMPAPNDAASLLEGIGPNLLFMHMAGDQALELGALGERTYEVLRQAPTALRAVHLYLDGNAAAYWPYLERHSPGVFDTDRRHGVAFAGTAHHIWQWLLSHFLDPAWLPRDDARGLFALTEWHIAALREDRGYREALARYDSEFAVVDRKFFDATEALLNAGAAWRSGVLRLASGHQAAATAGMRLQQDEFPRLRDVYQNAFEACCDSLWVLALIRNFASHGTDRPLEGLAYLENGSEKQVRTVAAFRKLVNARKLEALRADDDLRSVLAPLDPKLRNAIGHASARHDLRSGTIGSQTGEYMDYFDFVGRVYSLVLPLSACVSALRSARVAAAESRGEAMPADDG